MKLDHRSRPLSPHPFPGRTRVAAPRILLSPVSSAATPRRGEIRARGLVAVDPSGLPPLPVLNLVLLEPSLSSRPSCVGRRVAAVVSSLAGARFLLDPWHSLSLSSAGFVGRWSGLRIPVAMGLDSIFAVALFLGCKWRWLGLLDEPA